MCNHQHKIVYYIIYIYIYKNICGKTIMFPENMFDCASSLGVINLQGDIKVKVDPLAWILNLAAQGGQNNNCLWQTFSFLGVHPGSSPAKLHNWTVSDHPRVETSKHPLPAGPALTCQQGAESPTWPEIQWQKSQRISPTARKQRPRIFTWEP